MTFTDTTYEIEGGVATITINRPEKRNALRLQTWQELIKAAEVAAADRSVRAVVITGAGDVAFSAGGDYTMAKDFAGDVGASRAHAFDRMLRLSRTLSEMDKPVIGAVNGLCVGGGAELLCFFDFVYAADHATFHFNGTQLGGCSWWGAPQLLPLMVGLRRAEELLWMSRRMTAAEAVEWGFINGAFPAAELPSEVAARVQTLLAFSENSLRLTKAAIRATRDVLLATQLNTAEGNAPAMAGAEVQAGLTAFRGREGHP